MRVLSSLRSLIVVPLVAVGACSGTGPSAAVLPEGARPLAVKAAYAEWYGRTEACAARTGNFSKIRFFEVPGVRTFTSEFGETVALWRKVGDEQYIIVSGEYVDNEMVLRHEMLHALLEREGHPAEYFQTRCALTWETWGASAAVAMH
jgi:hypothetical protein